MKIDIVQMRLDKAQLGKEIITLIEKFEEKYDVHLNMNFTNDPEKGRIVHLKSYI